MSDHGLQIGGVSPRGVPFDRGREHIEDLRLIGYLLKYFEYTSQGDQYLSRYDIREHAPQLAAKGRLLKDFDLLILANIDNHDSSRVYSNLTFNDVTKIANDLENGQTLAQLAQRYGRLYATRAEVYDFNRDGTSDADDAREFIRYKDVYHRGG